MHFLNENICILIKISLKFVPTALIDNKTSLVQIMALRQLGDKPLSQPLIAKFTDACATQQQFMEKLLTLESGAE